MPRSAPILFCISALLTVFFAVWAVFALDDTALTAFDRTVAQQMIRVSAEHDLGRATLIAMTHLGGVATMTFLACAGTLWQLKRGHGRLALAWALIVAGGALLNVILKETLDRPRPPPEWRDQAVHETNESFPSGHAQGGAIGYGMLAYALILLLARPHARAFLVVTAALWVGLIGFSRIYLRAHWFSDVVGGFAIGLAWLLFGLAIHQCLSSAPKDSGTTATPSP